jgi:hypothetical protein
LEIINKKKDDDGLSTIAAYDYQLNPN